MLSFSGRRSGILSGLSPNNFSLPPLAADLATVDLQEVREQLGALRDERLGLGEHLQVNSSRHFRVTALVIQSVCSFRCQRYGNDPDTEICVVNIISTTDSGSVALVAEKRVAFAGTP